MKKETIEFLEKCTREGIIDEVQKNRAFALDKEAQEKTEVTRGNFLNLTVALMSVFLMFFGIIVVYQKFNFINPIFKLTTSGILVLISLLGIAKTKVSKNYFLMELFVAINICAILMFTMSANMETAFRYKASTNNFLTALAMLPVFFAVETYIPLIVYCFVFLTSVVPELNLAFTSMPNVIFELIITLAYLLLLIYKFVSLYRDKGTMGIYSKYFSKEVILMTIEGLILLFIFRFCYLGNKTMDIVFVYIVMLWILLRRTTILKGLTPLPVAIDISVFFGIIYILLLSDAEYYNATMVLTYHTIYYLIIFLLKQRGYLEYAPVICRVQQQFYINLFMFVFAIDRILDTNNMWFVITVLLALFNTFIGIKFKSVMHSVIGFGIIITTLVFTALKIPSTMGGIMFTLAGITIAFVNRKMFREVLKGYE